MYEFVSGDYPLSEIEEAADRLFPYRDKEDPTKPSYHDGQRKAIVEAVHAIINLEHKDVIIEAPTGVGKSVIAYTIHKVFGDLVDRKSASQRKAHQAYLDSIKAGNPEADTSLIHDPWEPYLWKSTVTCPTKGLQDQYVHDFQDMVNFKGRKNYGCSAPTATAQTHYGNASCQQILRDRDCQRWRCPYVQAKNKWLIAPLRVSNSHLKISLDLEVFGGDHRHDLLIMDECHRLPDVLVDIFEMNINLKNMIALQAKGLPRGGEIVDLINKLYAAIGDNLKEGKIIAVTDEIKEAADDLRTVSSSIIETLTDKLRESTLSDIQEQFIDDLLTRLSSISTNAAALAQHQIQDIIVQSVVFEEHQMMEITLKPILASDVYAPALGWKADYRIFMSATVCGPEKYAETMGIGKFYYIEIDNPIPRDSRIVNYIPVGKMSGKFIDATKPHMLEAIDELIEAHIDENGLIHTASYKLAEYIKTWSKYSDRIIIGKDRKKTMAWLEHGADPDNKPVVVVSPSMVEGYDLKGDLCRFNIIAKVPFGSLGDPLIKYRADRDFGMYNRETILHVVQASGRGTRGVSDFSVNYILDESFDTLLSRGKKFMPSWFLDAIVVSE